MRCWVSSLVGTVFIKVLMVDVCEEEREGPSWRQRRQKAAGEVGVLRRGEAWPVSSGNVRSGDRNTCGCGGGSRSPCEFSPPRVPSLPVWSRALWLCPKPSLSRAGAPALAGDGGAQPVLV